MANEFIDGLYQAFYLLFTFDPEIWNIIEVSIRVSLTSTLVAALFSIPIGSFIALRDFRGKKSLLHAAFANPLSQYFYGFSSCGDGIDSFLFTIK